MRESSRGTSYALAMLLGVAFVVAFAACWLLAKIARPLGLLDEPGGANAQRKLARRPVALVGAFAIALGVIAAYVVGMNTQPMPSFAAWLVGAGAWIETPSSAAVLGVAAPRSDWCLIASFAAFVVGWIDDWTRDGLSALPKLALQALPAALLATPFALEGAPWTALAWFVAALWAMNAFNTYDNSDGAAACLAIVGFAVPVPAVAAACAGFLPWNLPWRARRGDGSTKSPDPASKLPHVYLGDSGSHALGLLCICVPLAWPTLLVPTLDLVRVSIVRIREGRKPWEGDLRHLAHLLRTRGLDAAATAVLLATIALPALIGGYAALQLHAPLWLAIGAATSAIGFQVVAMRVRHRD